MDLERLRPSGGGPVRFHLGSEWSVGRGSYLPCWMVICSKKSGGCLPQHRGNEKEKKEHVEVKKPRYFFLESDRR